MSRQALGLQGERWENGRNAPFFPKKTMNAYQILRFFNENEFLETSNDLDDSEISLFIEENRTLQGKKIETWIQQKRQKLTSRLKSVKETTAIEEIPAEELNNLLCRIIWRSSQWKFVICLSKSGDGTPLFSGAVFNQCTIVVGQKSPPQAHPKRCVVIDSHEDDWAWSAFG